MSMPQMDQLAECAIKQTGDPIAEILAEAVVTPAFEKEAEALVQPLKHIIGESAMETAAKKGLEKGFGGACEEAAGGKKGR
jgi:hypothetical protein